MLPPETMQTTLPAAARPASAAATRAPPRPRRSRACARPAGARRRRSRRAARPTRRRPAASVLPHARDQLAAARAVDQRRPVVDARRRARLRASRSTRRPGLGLGHDRLARRAAAALTALAIPVTSPPPPYGTTTVSTSGRSSRISRPIVPFPAITRVVGHRVDEQAVDALVARRSRSPSTTRRTAPDRPRRRAARSRRASSAARARGRRSSPARRARARRTRRPAPCCPALAVSDAVAQLARRGACSTALPAPRILNEFDRLQRLELELDLGGASTVEAHERRADGDAGEHLARAADLLERRSQRRPPCRRPPPRARAQRRARRRRGPRPRGRAT